MANYVLEGPRWGTGAVGTGGGTVTWAVDSTVSAGFTSQISAAFADWSSRANITFKQQASTSGAQISFHLLPGWAGQGARQHNIHLFWLEDALCKRDLRQRRGLARLRQSRSSATTPSTSSSSRYMKSATRSASIITIQARQ